VSRGAAGAVLVLIGAGLILGLAGVAGVVAGLGFGERIHALLPDEITSDPAAIGGAAAALGGALLLTGAIHLGLAAGIRRGRWLVASAVLCAVMAALALGWAVTALVTAAAGIASAAAMLPAGIGLGVVALAYAWATAALLRARAGSRPPI
jgi:hypothetical protein